MSKPIILYLPFDCLGLWTRHPKRLKILKNKNKKSLPKNHNSRRLKNKIKNACSTVALFDCLHAAHIIINNIYEEMRFAQVFCL